MAYKITNIEGDLTVGHNETIGGTLNVNGKTTFKGGVDIKGFLECKFIKDWCKGFFANSSDLFTAYPNPQPGWVAFVQVDGKYYLYRENKGSWSFTSTDASQFIQIVGDINYYTQEVGELRKEVADNKDSLSSSIGKIEKLEQTTAEISKKVIELVDVSELDSLVAIPMPANGKADYWLTQTSGGITTIIGRVFLFEDNLIHKVTQVVMSNQRLDDNYPDGSHANEGLTVCCRFYGHTGNDVPLKQWTPWKKLYDSEERLIYKGETVDSNSQSTDVIADVNIQTAEDAVQIVSKSWGANSWNVRATIYPATQWKAGVMSNKQCKSLEELGSFLSKLKTAFGTTDLDTIVSKLAVVK